MKTYFNELLNTQDFGYKDVNKIDKTRDKYKDNLKLITNEIKLYLFRVDYSYKTQRGNQRENYKTLVMPQCDSELAKSNVIDFINKVNKEFPHRQLSNVKILNSCYEEIIIPLI